MEEKNQIVTQIIFLNKVLYRIFSLDIIVFQGRDGSGIL